MKSLADSVAAMRDIQRDADVAVASTETVVAAALEPPASPIAGALWALSACLLSPLLYKSELDASFVSADAWFLDSIRASNPVPACRSRFRLLHDVELSARIMVMA
jgi:hypothetical protein